MPKAAQKNLNPKTTFREGKNVTPTRQNHHTAGSGIGHGFDTGKRR
jgi:hypothetical protein